MKEIKSLYFILISGLLLCNINFGYGQKDTLVLKISRPASNITLHTADTVFHTNKKNPIYVEITGKNTVYRVIALKGTVRRFPNNRFEISYKEPCETVIKVFEKTPQGTTRVGLAEAFKVVAPPQPTVYVCGVKSDSAIDIKHLTYVGALNADLKGSDVIPAVMSYDVFIPGEEDSVHVRGSKFPIGLKNKMYDIKEGQILTFRNINVFMPGGDVAKVDEVRVFIARTDQYSVGHRNDMIRED